MSFIRPTSIEEAVTLLNEYGDVAVLLAGGQSLIPMLNLRLARPEILIDIARIPELSGVSKTGGQLRIGATTTQRGAETSSLLKEHCSLIPRAIAHIGHRQIRNLGTVGGSLAHADPAAELPAVALALGANIQLIGPDGPRMVPGSDFFVGPFTTARANGEIVIGIEFDPLPPDEGSIVEISRRSGDFAIAGVVGVRVGEKLRLSAFGIAWTPVRLEAAEDVMNTGDWSAGKIAAAAEASVDSVETGSDIHADAAYRRDALRSLTTSVLEDLRPHE